MTKQAQRNINRIYASVKRVYKLYSKEMLKSESGELLHKMPSKADVREKYLSMRGYSFKSRKEQFLRDPFYQISKKTESRELKVFSKIMGKQKTLRLEEFMKEKGVSKSSKAYKMEKLRIEEEQETNFKDLSSKIGGMTTREFAEVIQDDIMDTYRKLIRNGATSKEAQKEIAHHYFGS